jgi:hypothetical protein
MKFDVIIVNELARDFFFDDGAAGDLRDGWMIFLNVRAARASCAGRETAHCKRALSDGVDFAVRAHQRGLQKHTAIQTFGVTHRGDRDVEAIAGLHERLDVGGHENGGDVFRGNGRSGKVDSLALQRVGDRLHGVFGIFVAVASEADDEAPAGKLVVARAGDHDEVLNARTDG